MQDSQAIPARLLKPGLQGCNLLSLQPHPYARMLLLEPDAEFVETLHVALQFLCMHPFQAGIEQGDTVQQRFGIGAGKFGSS